MILRRVFRDLRLWRSSSSKSMKHMQKSMKPGAGTDSSSSDSDEDSDGDDGLDLDDAIIAKSIKKKPRKAKNADKDK